MNDIERIALSRQISREDAEAIFNRAVARSEKRLAAMLAAERTRKAELIVQASEPISEATAAAVEKLLSKKLNKIARWEVSQVVGAQAWNTLANPQTRAAGIAAMTEAEGRKVTGK